MTESFSLCLRLVKSLVTIETKPICQVADAIYALHYKKFENKSSITFNNIKKLI
jgi:hypothetical protein